MSKNDSLSTFSQVLLHVLDAARSPLSIEELTVRLEARLPASPIEGRIRPYLRHALSEYVTYHLSEDAWTLKPRYEGYFGEGDVSENQVANETESGRESSGHGTETSAERPSVDAALSVTEPPDDPDGEQAETRRGSNADALSQSILSLLSRTSEGLTTSDITALIAFSGRNVSREEVNQRLYGELGSRVIKLENQEWVLVDMNGGDDVGSGGENERPLDDSSLDSPVPPARSEDLGSGIRSLLAPDGLQALAAVRAGDHIEKGKTDATEHRDGTNDTKTDQDVSGPVLSIQTTPRNGTSLVRNFELASSVLKVLNLFQKPLLSQQLEKLLTVMGTPASCADIKTCLRSVLQPYVRQDGEGWVLRHQESESQVGERLNDTVTRAHVSNLNYTYIFEDMAADSSILFSSDVRGGDVFVRLNKNHPAYASLTQYVDNDRDGYSAVELLLIAWVEMESDLNGRQKHIAENNRHDWGRSLRRIIKQND